MKKDELTTFISLKWIYRSCLMIFWLGLPVVSRQLCRTCPMGSISHRWRSICTELNLSVC